MQTLASSPAERQPARPHVAPLLDIPAVAQIAALGRRFCLWREEVRDDTPTKVPLRKNGAKAKSSDPSTWCTFEQAVTALEELRAEGTQVNGIGVMLGRLDDGRFLVGGDIDLGRSPKTGVIESWGRRIIDRAATYTEVSPSGTGLKMLGFVDRLPPPLTCDKGPKGLEVIPPGWTMPEGAEGGNHKIAEIGLYPAGRFFTITGQHLDSTPDELTDITEAFAEIAHRAVQF